MILLSPSSKFRVRYEVAEGQPYSHLDRMILKAVAEGSCTQDSLVKVFNVHHRLVIQSLVTLTQAGWIALGNSPEEQFLITPLGKSALTDDKLPEFIEKSTRNFYVILDRTTGLVVAENQVPYTNKLLLQKRELFDKRVCLAMEFFDNKVDEGEIIHILPRGRGQRLHWVGPIEMVTKGTEYILVDFDEAKKKIMNLPAKLAEALLPYVLLKVEEIRAREEREGSAESYANWATNEFDDITYGARVELPNPLSDYVPFDWESNNLLLGEVSHENILHAALEQAKTTVFIASSAVTNQRITELQDGLVAALKRGVDIHILRGIKSDSDSIQTIIEIAEKEDSPNSGKLISNRIASQSNARLILWDNAEGEFSACLGSYDWLNHDSGYKNVGLQITNPLLVSYLARHAAGLWVGTRGEALSGVPDRWRRISVGIEAKVNWLNDIKRDTGVKAKLFFTQEHFPLRHNWILNSKERLTIASPFMSGLINSILQRRKPATPEVSLPLELYFAELSEGVQDALLEKRATKTKALSTRLIVADDKVCISSFNFLADQFEKKQNIREVGLVLISEDVSKEVREKFLEVVSLQQ